MFAHAGHDADGDIDGDSVERLVASLQDPSAKQADVSYRATFDVDAFLRFAAAQPGAKAKQMQLLQELVDYFIDGPVVASQAAVELNQHGIVMTSETDHIRVPLPAFDQSVLRSLPAETMLLLAWQLNGQLVRDVLALLRPHVGDDLQN